MKRLTTHIILTLCMVFSMTCNAMIAEEELEIAHVHLGQPVGPLVEAIGPNHVTDKFPNNCTAYYIVKNRPSNPIQEFVIIAKDTGNKPVVTVAVINVPEVSTKAGIHVGSTVDEVKKAYGIPDKSIDPMGTEIPIDNKDYKGALILKYETNSGNHLQFTLEGSERKVTSFGMESKDRWK